MAIAAAAGSEERRAAPAIRAGVRVELPFVVTDADMAAFAALSGDRNPIHADAAYARARGLRGPAVYGGLLVAKVSELIGMRLPTTRCLWNGLKIDFRRPLHVGEEAILCGEITHVAESVRSLTLALRIHAGDRLVASGSAEVSYWDD